MYFLLIERANEMKLNKYQKEAFVSAVMQDIPSVDYVEQFRVLVQGDALSQLPDAIKLIVKDTNLSQYITLTYVYLDGCRCMGRVAIFNCQGAYKCSDEIRAKCLELHDLFEAQNEARHNIRYKLESAISSVSTLKQAKQLMPDLIKYLPQEHEKTTQPPAITGLSDDLRLLGLVLPK